MPEIKETTQEQAFEEGKAACQKKHAGDRQGFNGCMQSLTRRLAPKGRKKDMAEMSKKKAK